MCVCSLLTAACVHLDGLNAEHEFQVWAPHVTSFPFLFLYLFLCAALKDNQTFMPLFYNKLNCISSQSIQTAKYDPFAVRLSTRTV